MPLAKELIHQTVFEHCADAVIVAHIDRTIVSVNPAFCELFGYAADEVVGECGSMLYVDRGDFEQQGRLRYTTNPTDAPPSYVVRYRRKNGDSFFAEVRARLIRDESGSVVSYVATIRDINRQVKLSNLLSSVIALSSEQGADHAGAIREFLRIGCEYFELDGGLVTELVDGELLVKYAVDSTGEIEEGQHFEPERSFCGLVVRSDEVVTYCCAGRQGLADHPGYRLHGFESYIGTPLRVAGAFYGTLCFLGPEPRCDRFAEDDETLISLLAGWVGGHLAQQRSTLALETLTEKLARNAERFRRLYRETPAMLHSIDSSGRLVEVSDFWLEKMGYASRDEVLGRRSTDFLTEESRLFAESEMLPILWQTGMVKDVPYDVVRKDGSVLEVEVSSILDRAPGRTPIRSLAVIFDVGERNRALRELEAKNEKLRRLNEDLERFASVASHDLQEPLRKIQMFSRSLEESLDGRLSPEGAYALEVMTDAAGRMRQLISDLLAYSWAGHAELDLEAIQMDALLDAIMEDLAVQVAEAQADVRVEPLPRIHGDQILARQLFQNLLSNALKYRDGKRACRIRLGATRDAHDDVWHIFVKDNGIGFEPQHAEQIFQPFQRLHGRAEYDGSGFGLSICQRIAERHGWAIRGEGVPGEGARFVVIVPVRAGMAGAE